MKQILGLMGLLIGLLFIVSCVPVAKLYDCPDGTKVTNPAACPAPTQPTGGGTQGQTPKETQPPVPVKGVITEAAQALFSKFTKVTSLQFSYVESPAVLPDNVYYVTKDKMKITLSMKSKYDDTNWYDNVYLDFADKIGFAYCENKVLCKPENLNRAFNVDYSKHIIQTPFDWMAKITAANLTGRSKNLESRNSFEVYFEINGTSGTMFVDSFFSVPLYIFFEGKTYEFRDLMVNEVKATDLAHQTT